MSILIDENTTFIIQGITGREAVNMTRECLDYGSKVVGGVTPGRGGRDVYGVPVYDTVKEITAKQRVDGSVLTVPPAFVRDAAFEAIENGDQAARHRDGAHPAATRSRRWSSWRSGTGARLIGPNCLGVIVAGQDAAWAASAGRRRRRGARTRPGRSA